MLALIRLRPPLKKGNSLLPPFPKGRRRRPEPHQSRQAMQWDFGAGR